MRKTTKNNRSSKPNDRSASSSGKSDKSSFSKYRSKSSDKPAFKRKSADGDSKKRSESGSFRDKDKSEKRSFRPKSGSGERSRSDKPRFSHHEDGGEKRETRPRTDNRDAKPERRSFRDSKKPSTGRGDKPRFNHEEGEKRGFRPKTTDREKTSDRPAFNKDEKFGDKKRRAKPRFGSDEKRPFTGRDKEQDGGKGKPAFAERKKFGDKPKYAPKREGFFKKPDDIKQSEFVKRVKYDEFEEGHSFSGPIEKKKFSKDKKPRPAAPAPSADGLIRLNKYLSNAGVASRRDADNLILSGAVKVNGVVVDQLGSKIKPTDKVTYGGESVRSERKVYLLLNKPKDYISTLDDPQERKTVMELIAGACRERVYPVGRLDRNTTGLLLFTNDGELTTKLTHPKFGVKKIYHVSLNKGLKTDDFKAIIEGVELEDGLIKADDLAFVGEGKKEIGIEIHSGRNRIVRRLFEHLGYDVLKLDRVAFAGLTKKDLPRGKHRFLTAKEISFLQMIG